MGSTFIEGSVLDKQFRFTPIHNLGQEDLYDHLTVAERRVGSMMVSLSNRHVTYGTITLEETTLPAIHIYYGNNPPSPNKDE